MHAIKPSDSRTFKLSNLLSVALCLCVTLAFAGCRVVEVENRGEAVLLGADGGVCTGANLWPRAFKEMYRAAKAGDTEKVRELQRFTTTSSYLLYGLGQGQSGFLKGVKAALAEMGLIQNVLAAPFVPFDGLKQKSVRSALKVLRREMAL